MFRFLGFTTGAAITIGTMIMIVGMPELSEPQVDDPPAAVPMASVAPPAVPEATRPETVTAADEQPEPPPARPPDVDAHWHSFWNPFRSEIAANGFATRLTAVTGIDYRVVRLKPGSYQVAFAYADDSERASKIAQIEKATGLELPEERP